MLCECVNVCVCDSLVDTFNHFHMFALNPSCGLINADRLPESPEERSPCALGSLWRLGSFGQVKTCRKRLIQFLESCFCVFCCCSIWFLCVMCCFFFVCVFGGEMCTKIKCWCFNFVWSVFFPVQDCFFLRKEYVYCMVRMYIWYVCLQTNLWVSKPVSHVDIGQKLRRNGMGFENHGVLWQFGFDPWPYVPSGKLTVWPWK